MITKLTPTVEKATPRPELRAHRKRVAIFVLCVSTCVAGVGGLACSASPSPPTVVIPAAPGSSTAAIAPAEEGAWFQPNGSLIAVDAQGTKSPELSAPIAPCVTALNKGGAYPAERFAQERMADEASLTFPYFLGACSEQYRIVPPKPGEPLSPEQARQNYQNVAQCTFETHYGKPYWVPQLIDDVDVCRRALGVGWQLPTSASLRRFNDRHRELLHQALKDVPYGGGYDSLLLYARDERGKLTFIDLSPPSVRNKSGTGSMQIGEHEAKRSLQVPAASLRCVRDGRAMPKTDLPPVKPLAASCGEVLAAFSSGKGKGAARGLRPIVTPQPEPEPQTPPEPALLRLREHTQKIEAAPDSFDPTVTLREVERARPASVRALEKGKHSVRDQLAKYMQRAAQAYRELQNPGLSAEERGRRLAQLQRDASIVVTLQQGLSPRQSDERLVREAMRTIHRLIRARYARAYREYKHWIVIGKPTQGATRNVAAIERDVSALRKLKEKVDEITGTKTGDSLVLPPPSAFGK